MPEETSQTTTPPTTTTPATPPAPEPSPSTAAPSSSPATDTEPTILNEKEPVAPQGAPEKYEDFKVPEGHTLDEAVATEFTTLAKDMNLSQSQAQSLVDFYVAKTQEAFSAPFDTYKRMQEEWVEQVKSHPEIRGKLDQVKSTIAGALDGLGDAALATDFRRAMDLTGAGNHPAFVRVLYKLAQAVTEGSGVKGTGPSPHGQNQGQAARPSIANALYPNLPSG